MSKVAAVGIEAIISGLVASGALTIGQGKQMDGSTAIGSLRIPKGQGEIMKIPKGSTDPNKIYIKKFAKSLKEVLKSTDLIGQKAGSLIKYSKGIFNMPISKFKEQLIGDQVVIDGILENFKSKGGKRPDLRSITKEDILAGMKQPNIIEKIIEYGNELNSGSLSRNITVAGATGSKPAGGKSSTSTSTKTSTSTDEKSETKTETDTDVDTDKRPPFPIDPETDDEEDKPRLPEKPEEPEKKGDPEIIERPVNVRNVIRKKDPKKWYPEYKFGGQSVLALTDTEKLQDLKNYTLFDLVNPLLTGDPNNLLAVQNQLKENRRFYNTFENSKPEAPLPPPPKSLYNNSIPMKDTMRDNTYPMRYSNERQNLYYDKWYDQDRRDLNYKMDIANRGGLIDPDLEQVMNRKRPEQSYSGLVDLPVNLMSENDFKYL